MPYKDREKKLAAMRAWREKRIAQGYGKWLYERRKLRFNDAERFRTAIEETLQALYAIPTPLSQDNDDRALASAIDTLERALHESKEAEEALGEFKEETDATEGSATA